MTPKFRIQRCLYASILLVLFGSLSINAGIPIRPGTFSLTSPIGSDLLRKNNPYDGRKRHCAAFARYGLYLLTGRMYVTYGSARRWAYRATRLKATCPLVFVQPDDLLFFRDGRHRINHVAIVLRTDYEDSENFAITFQDERGTHDWIYPESKAYLGMKPVFGAHPAQLETSNG